jgi:Lrp/AsnC family transcriptional regulator, leucine-responsive regulatory protein
MRGFTLESEKTIDDVGWQILCELQENARISYSELGRRVGLTAPAVAERVKRMEDAGIIEGYRVNLNLEKIGLPMQAYIRIATTEQMCLRFGGIARDFPEILECHRVTGGDSYILKAALSSVSHLEILLNRLLPYGNTVTSLILSTTVANRVIAPSEPVPTWDFAYARGQK